MRIDRESDTRVRAKKKADVVKKVGRKNGVAVEQCVHNADYYLRARARERLPLLSSLYDTLQIVKIGAIKSIILCGA